MRVIDFCAGAGGTSEGVRSAGGEIVAAIDKDPLALATHAHNHPCHHIESDLESLDPDDLPEHDVAAWCPPCQEFSWASGTSAALAEGRLMKAMLKVTATCLPQYVLFENVPAVRAWNGFTEWYTGLQALGYWIASGVVDASPWVPQERPRYVLLGRRGVRPPTLPQPPRRVKPLAASKIVDWNKGEWSKTYMRSAAVRRRISAATNRFGERFLLSSHSGQAEYAGRDIERPIGTITTAVHWSIVDGERIRFLTPRECARAQGFPEKYRFLGGIVEQHRQIGNAFPPAMAAAAFRALVD